MTTFPHISSDYMSDRVRNKFREWEYVEEEVEEHYIESDPDTGEEVARSRLVKRIVKDDKGNDQIRIKRDLWATMELFTQDFRLGNLSTRELHLVRFNIDLCSDILIVLPDSFHKPALMSLERSISIVETSQSKGGFLRNLFNTFFQHSSLKEEQPTKRSFFGLGKKNKVE
jgi:hypothetical protein